MTPGQEAFEAYCEVVKNTAHTGRPIPPWAALPEHIQEAWEAGVGSVLKDRTYINGRKLNNLEKTALRRALDTFIQAHLGQPQKVMECCLMLWDSHAAEAEPGIANSVKKMLDVAAALTTGIRNGGPGIFNTARVHNDGRLAYRILAMLEGDELREGMVQPNGEPS